MLVLFGGQVLVLMTYYLTFYVRCRHAAIAKYFGDEMPVCNRACDHCKNPDTVTKQLDLLQRLDIRKAQALVTKPAAAGPFGYISDLYAGGRKGYGFER